MPPRPVPNASALLLESSGGRATGALVIADLHLGLGSTPERPDGPPGATATSLAEQLLTLSSRSRARRLIVAGDVKHPIVGTPPWLRPVVFGFFSELLREGLEVQVVLGNHDVGLVPHLPREVDVVGPKGAVVDGVGIFHGHRWPSSEVLAASVLVAGHLHPGYRFAPSPSHPDGKHRCWVRVEFPPAAPVPQRRPKHWLAARELIVLPAFHPLAGTESLNRERPTRGRSFLFGRFLSRGTARAYLLDGSDLGELATARRDPAGELPEAPPP